MRASRLILLLVFILSAGALQAQTTYTWDPNGLTADTGTSGGIWDTSTPNWANGGVAVWFNDGSVRAVFPISLTPETDTYIAGGSYTIDVATAIQTRGMDLGAIYWNPSSTTTFTGVGSITLTDSHITVEDTTAAFNVPLISTVGLELDKSFNTGGTLQLNTANPGLAGVTTLTRGTLVYNHPGALGPETAGNGIVIGQGTLNFNYVSGGDFSYSLADPITISGTNEFAPHFSIEFETYASRSATLTGPITLQQDVKFQGGPLNDYGSAQIISTGVISESSAGKNVRIVGDVALSGANTFTGKLYLGNGYNDDGRVTVPVFNDDLADGPLGAGSGLQLGYNAGEGGAHGEVMYTGGTASSNRTIQIEGDLGVLRVSNPSSTLTLTGIISGSGSGTSHSLEKTGPGSLVLKAANTFTGQTKLSKGTLIVGHSNALGTSSGEIEVGHSTDTAASDDLSLLLEDLITLSLPVHVYHYNNEGGQTTLGMAGSGTSTFAGDVVLERDIEVKADSGGLVNFTGAVNDLSPGPNITKSGTGLAVFSGGVTLSGGGITVNGGELRLIGAVSVASTINVYGGTTLSGNATINRDVFMAGGSFLSPGNGLGTMTMDSIYVSNGGAGGVIKWELGALTTSDTAQFDRIVFTGAGTNSEIYPTTRLDLDLSLLDLSSRPGNANPALNATFWQTEQDWMVIDFTNGSGSGNLADGTLHPLLVTNGVWAGGTFDTFVGGGAGEFALFTAGDVFLRFTPVAVPEPATYALWLGLGSALGLLPRLRRRA